jgi:DNA-binding MarR family transcriptional regulator
MKTATRRLADPAPDMTLANKLCFAVYSAAHAFNSVYKPHLDAIDLTYPQYLVMIVLWERDGRTVKEIGGELYLDSGTLTPLLKRMEAAGLVRRVRDKEDERQVRITLTPQGAALRSKAEKIPAAIRCALGGDAGDPEKLHKDVVALRDALNASMEAAGANAKRSAR